MLFFVFFIFVFLLKGQQEFSLNQAIDIALENNYKYRISQLNVDYSSKNILQGYLNFAPTVTIDHSQVEISDYALQQQLAQQEGFKQLLRALDLGEFADQIPNTAFRKVYRSSMTVNWNLFAKGLALRELNERKLRHTILEIEADQAKLNTVFSVREAFYNLFIAEELMEIAKLRLKNTDQRVKQVQQFVNNGLRNNAELLRWQLQYSQAEEELIRAENGLSNTQKQFVFVLGMQMTEKAKTKRPEMSENLFADITEEMIKNLSVDDLNDMKKSILENQIAIDNKFYTYGKFLPSVNVKYVKNWQQSNRA
ncbi:MAG: TolC family protein, partial [Calditrichaeota bacterium]|nr:TolC family protein [Calditrichota bacterium]